MKEQTLSYSKTITKNVTLWAAPRCVSTAFEKTFAQRSDTEVVHEPFCDVYFFSKWRRSSRFGECPELLNYSSEQAIAQIRSQTAPLVFTKEHAYQALPYIDQDFLASSINSFILRHPLEVMGSWYRVQEYPTAEEFGFTALERIWQIVTKELKQKPILVEATHFRQNPEQILMKYCQEIGVEFDSQMLNWNNGQLREWSPREAEFHAKWHSTLDQSKTIMPPTETQVNIRPEEVAIFEQALEIYEKILSYAFSP